MEKTANIDDIAELRLKGEYDKADLLLQQFHENTTRKQLQQKNKIRKINMSVSIPISDVLFIDEKGLKASELLREKISEVRNDKSD